MRLSYKKFKTMDFSVIDNTYVTITCEMLVPQLTLTIKTTNNKFINEINDSVTKGRTIDTYYIFPESSNMINMNNLTCYNFNIDMSFQGGFYNIILEAQINDSNIKFGNLFVEKKKKLYLLNEKIYPIDLSILLEMRENIKSKEELRDSLIGVML